MRFREITAYSGLAYANQLASVLINFLFIRTLSLSTLGDIAIAKVWMQFMDYSHLGLRFTLDRYVPVWNRHRCAQLLSICILVSSIVSGLIVCLALFLSTNQFLIFSFCLWGYSIAIATILKNFYRASANSAAMIATYVVCPTIPAIAQTVVLWIWGFNGFLIATILASVVTTLYLLRNSGPLICYMRNQLRYTLKSVRSATIFLFLNSVVIFLSFSIDRIILNAYATKEVLGEYSVILFAFSLLLTIPSTIAEFVFPKIIRTAVEHQRIYFPRQLLAILAPTVLCTFVAYVLAPFAVPRLTTYSQLVPAIQLVTIGVLPYAVSPVLFLVMSAFDMHAELLFSACTALTIYILLLLWGGSQATDKLLFFTYARVAYGYILLMAYGLSLPLCRPKAV